jgi:hypothetical protein
VDAVLRGSMGSGAEGVRRLLRPLRASEKHRVSMYRFYPKLGRRMKWPILIIVAFAVLLAAVVGYGISKMEFNSVPPSGDRIERQKAEADSKEIAARCGPDCAVASLVRVTSGVWKVEIRPTTGTHLCGYIHIDSFRPLSNGRFAGVDATSC